MTRILELLAVVAPIIGALLLLAYRRRSYTAFVWGLTGCLLALGGSVVAIFGGRASLLAAVTSGEGLSGVVERLEGWSAVRFGLLLGAAIALFVGALVDRRTGAEKPAAWISAGVVLGAGGLTMHLIHIDFGAERERLNAIVGLLLEAVQFGAIGVGVLLLCIAVVTGRPGHDDREDPAQLARRVGMSIYRAYAGSRRGSR